MRRLREVCRAAFGSVAATLPTIDATTAGNLYHDPVLTRRHDPTGLPAAMAARAVHMQVARMAHCRYSVSTDDG